MTSGRASNLRDCPVSKPGDDILSPVPENTQANYPVLERDLVFPDDVPLYLDQVARGWTVNGDALFLQALVSLYDSVGMLHEKLNMLTEKLGHLPKPSGPCPDHPEWARDGCPWHGMGEWKRSR